MTPFKIMRKSEVNKKKLFPLSVQAGLSVCSFLCMCLCVYLVSSYSGHGSGSKYYSSEDVQKTACRAVAMLFGCGSVKFDLHPHPTPHTPLHSLTHSHMQVHIHTPTDKNVCTQSLINTGFKYTHARTHTRMHECTHSCTGIPVLSHMLALTHLLCTHSHADCMHFNLMVPCVPYLIFILDLFAIDLTIYTINTVAF